MSDDVDHLGREAGLLVRRLRDWAGSAWDVSLPGGLTRADRIIRLIDDLAVLGERIGTGAPAGVCPPRLASHALADQVTVLANDVLAAAAAAGPQRPAVRALLADAHAAVVQARTDLAGDGFGFRVR